ncbi:MAG: hypothetical protein NWQ54_23770 [Paraglaciecola sp.]|nr:hypothetical protein [Paraglaciecola sp.]
MSLTAYLFEIRSIQPFLFASGKLKDMVKGSELIDFLCNEPLKTALTACGLSGYSEPEYSPRCAGGSFYLLIEDMNKAIAFRNLWTLFVSQLLPGIEQIDTIASGDTARMAIERGLKQLRTARNQARHQLPSASPITARSPRTGKASVAWLSGESLDEATSVKRQFNRPLESKNLTSRFSQDQGIKWPINFEADAPKDQRFPLIQGDKVALIHADGNGLGEILRLVNEAAKEKSDAEFISLYRQFSDGLEAATISACQAATNQVLVPHIERGGVIPARPLVLGGDDLTLIVRADLAFEFTEAFTHAFENKTQEFLSDLAQKLPQSSASKLPQKLTVCAGITFMKPSQPFAQCYALTESLCERAKKQSRAIKEREKLNIIPSSLAFHKVQASLIDDADQLFEREMIVKKVGESLKLGLPAYAIGEGFTDLPALAELKKLTYCFKPGLLNDKRLRALATLMHLDPSGAKKEYARWKSLAEKNSHTAQALRDFENTNQKLLGQVDKSLPANLDTNTSVLADLLAYLALTQPWKASNQGVTA